MHHLQYSDNFCSPRDSFWCKFDVRSSFQTQDTTKRSEISLFQIFHTKNGTVTMHKHVAIHAMSC